MRDYLSTQEVMRVLKWRQSKSITDARQDGRLPGAIKVGGRWFYPVQSVRNYATRRGNLSLARLDDLLTELGEEERT